MNEVTVTVKIEPPDGSWETANELIKHIIATNPAGDKLNIEVGNVFVERQRQNVNIKSPISQNSIYEKNIINYGQM